MITGPEHIPAHPLHWPAGRPRTAHRQRSKFKVSSFTDVRDGLLNELKLLRATRVILSTNLRLRQDGLPLANQAQPADTGVAVYFTYKGRHTCFACDCWHKVEDNMHAIRLTIEALRGIARWGSGDMMDRAFTGFAALPSTVAADPEWRVVLGVPGCRSLAEAEVAYRRKAQECHPDRGGSNEAMRQVNAAIEKARRELAG